MSVYHDAQMIVQESTHPRSPLSVDRGVIGRKLPMLRTAAGRCYLAHCPPADRAKVLELLESSKDPEDSFYLTASWLERTLSETLQRGYAARYHEQYNSHTSSIAVPIFSGTTLVGSMAVIWITKAMTLVEGVDQFLETMREAAQRITYRHDRMHAGA
jgi:IclR family mhp operon transcriptional activator